MAHDVFISYSSKDKAVADAVCARLEVQGIRVWIAPRDVPPGSDFAESIIDAIDDCKVFVLIWSADANASAHILNEVNEAFNKGIVIIPFRIQDVQPTRAMQYYIGRTHWLDALSQPLEQHIAKLAATITAVLRHGPVEGKEQGVANAPWQTLVEQHVTGPSSPQADESHMADSVYPTPDSVPAKKAFKPANILWIAGAIIGLGLAAVLVIQSLKPADKVIQQDGSTQVVVPTQAAILSQPTSTTASPLSPIPTEEPTAVQEDAFSSGILAKINTSPPAFEDDFWDENIAWDYLNYLNTDICDPQQAEMAAKEGSLIVILKPGCEILHLYHPDLEFTNYVMQVQLKLQDQAGLKFDAEFPDAVYTGWTFNLMFSVFNNWWRVEKPKYLGMLVEGEGIGSGPLQNSPQWPFTITAIKSGAEHYYYMNTTLLTKYVELDSNFTGRSLLRLTPVMREVSEDPVSIEILGVKVWDLDAIQ